LVCYERADRVTPRMLLARLRQLGPLFLGLVLLAQAVAIVPLISTHLQHAFETEQDMAADRAEGGEVRHAHHHHAHRDGGQHEHGSADPNDQCCTLHNHLAGVLPVARGPSRSSVTAAIIVVPSPSLVSTDPGALERPPKLPLPI
jgi:hypothetical protein